MAGCAAKTSVLAVQMQNPEPMGGVTVAMCPPLYTVSGSKELLVMSGVFLEFRCAGKPKRASTLWFLRSSPKLLVVLQLCFGSRV